MRALILAVALVSIPSFTYAQEPWALRGSRGLHVAVIDGESREWQGRLLEVARDAITLEVDADARRFELANVKRVDVHGDKVWDGAIKGAVFGAVVGAVVGGGRFALQGAFAYALVGVGMDALNSCTHTVYRAPARAAGVKITW